MKRFRLSGHTRGSLTQNVEGRLSIPRFGLHLILFALIIVVAGSYLYYMNQTATGGFDIKGLEQHVEELNKNNTQLEVQAAELQSMNTIAALSEGMEMVATTHIEYLPAVGSTVAVR